MQREPLRDRMRGRWHGVLPSLGVPAAFLNGKHQPCPLCGGKDRARFDDKEGNGTWICSHCGAGDGIALVMKINGLDFKTAADRIEAVAGDVEPRAAKPKADVKQQIRTMRETWAAAKPIGSAVKQYLRSRGIAIEAITDLRESARHEMLAVVRDVHGNGCQVHRTLLTADGKKADVERPRLFMPGPIPKGAAVRLMPCDATLGIAEGIETAMSAAMMFDMPCWAALNTSLLKAWEPPTGVSSVVVFGDNDVNCAGQAAAYELARRLAPFVSVRVEIPSQSGADWNDVLRESAWPS
jgi:putative DNA primase/helicase